MNIQKLRLQRGWSQQQRAELSGAQLPHDPAHRKRATRQRRVPQITGVGLQVHPLLRRGVGAKAGGKAAVATALSVHRPQ